jgi:N-acetylmuramoyl-L-alanine amidase
MLNAKNIQYLVIHCSDTEDKNELSAIDIHKMHLGFGWDGIGYHKVILKSGEIQNGRPEYWVGAHVRGKNNISLGVCLIGRTSFTPKQFISLKKVLQKWKILYPRAKIIGHCDVTNTKKTCPNFDVEKWIQKISI